MNRHANAYQLASLAGMIQEPLFDSDFLRSHVENCESCSNRQKALTGRGFAVKAIAGAEPAGIAPGVIYHINWDTRVLGPAPEEIPLIVAASEQYADPVTGIKTVEAMALHDWPMLAADGDMLLQITDGIAADKVLCLWSKTELPLQLVQTDSPAGTLGLDSGTALYDYLETGTVGNPLYMVSRMVGGRWSPKEQVRRKTMAALNSVAASLATRRNLKLKVLDAVAGDIPEGITPPEAGNWLTLTAMLQAVVLGAQKETQIPSEEAPAVVQEESSWYAEEEQPQYAIAASADPFKDEAFVSRCEDFARQGRGPRGGAFVRLLLSSEKFVRGGALKDLRIAQKQLETYGG